MAKQTQKQSRKELLKSDDAFIQAANTGAEWVNENKGLVIGAVLAVVAAVGGGIFASTAVSSAAASEATDLANAMMVLNAELVPEADANPDAEPPTFASEEDRRKAARTAFEPLAGDSGSGLLARFYAASLAEESGDLDAAKQGFDALVSALTPSHSLYFLAIERAAYVHERSGDLDGAMQIWGRIGSGEKFYRDRSAYHIARLTEAKGESKRAVELYSAVEEQFPESAVVATTKNRLSLLKEQGFTAPEPAPEPAPASADDAGENSEPETP